MNNYQLPPVEQLDGTRVETEAVLDAVTKPKPLSFVYNGLKFCAMFDASLINTGALLSHDARRAALKRDAISRDPEMARGADFVDEVGASIEDMTDAEARAELGDEGFARLLDFSRRARLASIEENAEMLPIRIDLLAPGIVAWNLPGIEPSATALHANAQLATAVIPEVWEVFRPTMPVFEAQLTATKKAARSKKSATTSPATEAKESSTSDS